MSYSLVLLLCVCVCVRVSGLSSGGLQHEARDDLIAECRGSA